ncbi:MAG: chalcone isomerase family protein [Desulfamplus sp.]|nr:chalcone isomerase family protein [Desulfamplus sp.]
MVKKGLLGRLFKIESLISISLLFMLIVSTPSVYGADNPKIADKITLDGGKGELVLNGSGTRRKFGFKVYEGALYLQAKSTDSKKIVEADEPMAIAMLWKRDVPKDKTLEVFAEGFKYGAGANYDAQKSNIDAFLKNIVDAKEQDSWKYLYIPGEGTSIYCNDKSVATIAGLDFKKALFSIWLLEDATFKGDSDLRKGMLGK